MNDSWNGAAWGESFTGKIFGVGLNKTGTTALGRALTVLGFSSFHHESTFYPARRVDTLINRAIAEDQEPFTYLRRLARFDGYFDVRVVERRFEYFDRHFPGSKFILHTRDFDSWIASRIKHVERNQGNLVRGWQEVDVESWTTLWNDQHRRVRDYFANRPADLLEINIPAGEGWERLAPFLDRAVPAEGFPHLNVAGSGGREAGDRSVPERIVAGVGHGLRQAILMARSPRSS